MAARGTPVTLVARSADLLAAMAAETGCQALTADTADPGQRTGRIDRAEQAYGPLDVVVNIAGTCAAGSTLTMGGEQMAALFQLDLLAPAELCRQALPGMVERGRGHVVNVSSGFSTFVAPGLVPSWASKAHLTGGCVRSSRAPMSARRWPSPGRCVPGCTPTSSASA